jgi:homogentisate 1,2-dioxygenase
MGCCFPYVLVCFLALVLFTDLLQKDTYRPPYYHRNAASELMGLIYGDYGGRSDEFMPGSISFECGSTFTIIP